MHSIELHPEAEFELEEAATWYFTESQGTEVAFLREFLDACERIKESPKVWRIFNDDCRRILLDRFPYALIYTITEEKIIILAIAHHKRKPLYWKNRTQPEST